MKIIYFLVSWLAVGQLTLLLKEIRKLIIAIKS